MPPVAPRAPAFVAFSAGLKLFASDFWARDGIEPTRGKGPPLIRAYFLPPAHSTPVDQASRPIANRVKFSPPIPHPLTARIRTARQVAILCSPEGIKKGHQMVPKESLIWIKNGTRFGPQVAPILDPKLPPFWTQSCIHFGPKVAPNLDQKLTPFWTKSVPKI